MSKIILLDSLGLKPSDVQDIAASTLAGGVGGEVYLARSRTQSLGISAGVIGGLSVNEDGGGSFRRINGTSADFTSFSGLSQKDMMQAASDLKNIPNLETSKGNVVKVTGSFDAKRYQSGGVFGNKTPQDWAQLLKDVDEYVRGKCQYVSNVQANLVASEEEVVIARADGKFLTDVRPQVRLFMTVTVNKDGRKETGTGNVGGRFSIENVFDTQAWQAAADRAIRICENNLTAIDAPSGDGFDIVVCEGWGGVILHEAFGHSLEADAHRKGEAGFQGMLGKQVASKDVTVYDDGTMFEKRGSLSFDDEGNPTHNNVLVEDGVLVGLMTDEISARAMNLPITGNGRRESYDCKPMPRMTNTVMANGDANVDDLIKDVKEGIYCTSFAGGQVDITSTQFVFVADEARLIQNGKLGPYVKGATLSGMGKTAYMNVDGVAGDSDTGNGNCGKGGQSVPVCVGQPTIRIRAGEISVGGTS